MDGRPGDGVSWDGSSSQLGFEQRESVEVDWPGRRDTVTRVPWMKQPLRSTTETARNSTGDPLPKQTGSSFASLRLCVFAFISSKQPGSLREIHYQCRDLCGRSTTFASLHLCVFAFISSKQPYARSPPSPPNPLLPPARGSRVSIAMLSTRRSPNHVVHRRQVAGLRRR